MEGEKRCTYCGRVKPLSDFYANTQRNGIIRHHSRCKKCFYLKQKQNKVRAEARGGKTQISVIGNYLSFPYHIDKIILWAISTKAMQGEGYGRAWVEGQD